MNTLATLLEKRTKKETKITNERQELLQNILTCLNRERLGTKYKQVEAKILAIKLSHVPTEDLYFFHRKCSLYKGAYGKCFWGSLKVR